MNPIQFQDYQRIFILTGAGISAASGLPTFRGPDGLLVKEAMWASDSTNLPASLPALWRLYGGLRQKAQEVEPNAAHRAIARLEAELRPGCSLLVATQNVDGLHQAAGSREVAELHGSVLHTRCTNSDCALAPFRDPQVPGNTPPVCPECGCALRPDIVLFGEALPLDVLERVGEALPVCDLFLAIGTSGTVSPASEFVRVAAQSKARTILVNLHRMNYRSPYFQEEYYGKAEELLPVLFGQAS